MGVAAWSWSSSLLIAFLCARACGSEEISFLTLGDWGGMALGGDYSFAVTKVAEAMASSADSLDAQFLVNAGDNFYWCGIISTEDFQVAEDYLNVYTAASLQIPWYSVLGNHEYGYNVTAQVDLTHSDPTGRWYMVSRGVSRGGECRGQ